MNHGFWGRTSLLREAGLERGLQGRREGEPHNTPLPKNLRSSARACGPGYDHPGLAVKGTVPPSTFCARFPCHQLMCRGSGSHPGNAGKSSKCKCVRTAWAFLSLPAFSARKPEVYPFVWLNHPLHSPGPYLKSLILSLETGSHSIA